MIFYFTFLFVIMKCILLDKQKESLGAELQPLFITVDPMRDDVEAVKQYVQGTYLPKILISP